MLRALLCDDENPARGLLERILREFSDVEIIASLSSSEQALNIINKGEIDIAFLDVEMPVLTGVETVNGMTCEPRPLVVFVSAHSEYAVDAFGIDAVDYILKPLTSERVRKAVDKAAHMHRLIAENQSGDDRTSSANPLDNTANDHSLRLFDAGRLFVVPHTDIVWVEAAGDYSLIHRTNGEIAVRRTLTALSRELPTSHFKRIHRSYIVALDHISKVRKLSKGEAELTVTGDHVLRVSRSYRQVVDQLTI